MPEAKSRDVWGLHFELWNKLDPGSRFGTHLA